MVSAAEVTGTRGLERIVESLAGEIQCQNGVEELRDPLWHQRDLLDRE